MSYLPTLYLKMKNTPNYHKWQERQGTPPTRLGQRSTTGELETEAFAPIRIQEERQIGLPSSSADGHQANGTFSIPEGEEGQAQYGGCSLFLGVEDWGRLIIRDEGSKVATEWGTGTQPVTYAYDEADRMVRLTTFRVDAGEISVDPSGRTDGDTTTWTYHTATGLELRKTYADGSSIVKTYDSFNRLATETNAIRKDGTWYAYGWDLTKNVTEVFDPAGYIRTTYTYTPYGEATATGDVTQPFTWSSEYADEELGLIYYNTATTTLPTADGLIEIVIGLMFTTCIHMRETILRIHWIC